MVVCVGVIVCKPSPHFDSDPHGWTGLAQIHQRVDKQPDLLGKETPLDDCELWSSWSRTTSAHILVFGAYGLLTEVVFVLQE